MMIKIKEIFDFKGRMCVVVEMLAAEETMFSSLLHSIWPFHNGYVEVLKKNKGKDYQKFIDMIDTDELTFSGNFDYIKNDRIPKDKWFFGFDSAHYQNEEHPESKTFENVKKRTIELAEEMIRKRI